MVLKVQQNESEVQRIAGQTISNRCMSLTYQSPICHMKTTKLLLAIGKVGQKFTVV